VRFREGTLGEQSPRIFHVSLRRLRALFRLELPHADLKRGAKSQQIQYFEWWAL
jgi:hypothetical protein